MWYHLHGNLRFYAYFGETQTIQVCGVLPFFIAHSLSLFVSFFVWISLQKYHSRRRIQILCIYSRRKKIERRHTVKEVSVEKKKLCANFQGKQKASQSFAIDVFSRSDLNIFSCMSIFACCHTIKRRSRTINNGKKCTHNSKCLFVPILQFDYPKRFGSTGKKISLQISLQLIWEEHTSSFFSLFYI